MDHTFDEIWELNPNGDKERTRSTFNASCMFDHTLTSDLLYASYRSYLNYWQTKFGDRELKYVAAKDQLRPLIDFIDERLYHNVYRIPRNNRDTYLYGNEKSEDLAKYFEDFKRLEPTWKASTERHQD